MRKLIAAAATVALAAAGVLSAPTAYADDPATPEPTAPAVSEPAEPEPAPAQVGAVAPAPVVSLTRARRVLAGRALPHDPEPSLALRDLWMARARLSGDARFEADALLARPTDGARDPQGFGYTAPSKARCNARLCVHSVPRRGNPDHTRPKWAARTLAVMDEAWSVEVDGLGYRAPLRDRGRGGSPKFDVYLKDLGAAKLYGYCATERRGAGRTATSFCVLDNDFARRQFPLGTPRGNLRVTAAHEFFHAVQYAYDFAEDPWLMESTATWMEERVATEVDDNRQYLPYGQLYAPYLPLDMFVASAFYQYGNWIFWEYLSTRYGNAVVSDVWDQAGSLRGDGGKYSFRALDKVLQGQGGLAAVYTQFAGANAVPELTYPEGPTYETVRPSRRKVLSQAKSAKSYTARQSHMSSRTYRFVPGADLAGPTWQLAIAVDGPPLRTSPGAHVTVHRPDGSVESTVVTLDRTGNGVLSVPFAHESVDAVSVTLVNASSRMRCRTRTSLACAGRAVDDNLPFSVSAQAVSVR